MYLLTSHRNDTYELVKNEEELMHKLLVLTFEWCQSKIYRGPSYQELFDECVANKNFADIAQVFSVKPMVDKHYNDFTSASVGRRFCLERVY